MKVHTLSVRNWVLAIRSAMVRVFLSCGKKRMCTSFERGLILVKPERDSIRASVGMSHEAGFASWFGECDYVCFVGYDMSVYMVVAQNMHHGSQIVDHFTNQHFPGQEPSHRC